MQQPLPVAIASIAIVITSVPAFSQSPLTFEVASVKPHNASDRRMGTQFLPGGKFSATGVSLQAVISTAYDLPFQSPQLSGGPDWIRSQDGAYDIEAKAEDSAIPAGLSLHDRDSRMRLMLQALLADRFKLVILRETKDLPLYALVVAKNGPKLQKAKIEEKDCRADAPDGVSACHRLLGGQGRGLHGNAVDLADVVKFVGNWTDRPLVDRTRIEGLFDIDTEGWAPMRQRMPPPPGATPGPEDVAMADPARPTLYSIFDRLGLKMESSRGPVEMFVIANVEKPSEN
jgi:uncharacterized protein (TIGR03435 family)